MRKIEGLHFLQDYFYNICVDCLFISNPTALIQADLDPLPERLWRVRTGRRCGLEVSLPQATCHTVKDVTTFINRVSKYDSEIEFVIHRVNANYFSALYVGTLALFCNPHPYMRIDLQSVTVKLLNSLDTGKRPRDWKVIGSFIYDFYSLSPHIELRPKNIDWQFIKYPLYQLWEVGREIYDLLISTQRAYETFTRFNIYASGAILLDDHRSLESFSGSSFY